MNAHITRRLAAVLGAGALASVLGAGIASAGTAPTGGTVAATVSVTETISFAFTSAQSFTLDNGITAPAAVAWTVATNDAAGFTQSESAPNLGDGNGHTLAAGQLTEVLHSSTADHGVSTDGAAALTTTPATLRGDGIVTAGDTFSQDWSAAIPSTQASGNYSTTITYTVAGL